MEMNGVAYRKVSSFVLSFSVKLGLQNINWDKINQFRVSGNLEKYLKAKCRLCEQIKLNMALIEVEMGADDNKYSVHEVVVIRSVYMQHKQAEAIVGSHIEQVKAMMEWRKRQGEMLQGRLAEEITEVDNELPF